jgi:hypothetical protein
MAWKRYSPGARLFAFSLIIIWKRKAITDKKKANKRRNSLRF